MKYAKWYSSRRYLFIDLRNIIDSEILSHLKVAVNYLRSFLADIRLIIYKSFKLYLIIIGVSFRHFFFVLRCVRAVSGDNLFLHN